MNDYLSPPPHPHPPHTTPQPHPPCYCFSRWKKSGLVTTAAGGVLDGSWQACLSTFRHASSSTYFTMTIGFPWLGFLNAPFLRITVSRIFCLHRPSIGKENIYLHLSEGKHFYLYLCPYQRSSTFLPPQLTEENNICTRMLLTSQTKI